MNNNTKKKWQELDELWALYHYKYPDDFDIDDICKYTKITNSSFKMKLQNIRLIDTGIGLKNYSKLNKQIYDRYFGTSKEIIMKKMLELVLKK